MSEQSHGTGSPDSSQSNLPDLPRAQGKSDNIDGDGVRPPDSTFVMDAREKKLAIVIEKRFDRRITSIIRQESGDSYAGLPADHVLVNLDRQFPDVHFPERMMARLEREQDARIEREGRQDKLDMYEAETRRIDASEDRKHLNTAANRAFLVLALMLAVGLLLIFTGHETAGITLVGTSMATIIIAFLRQQFRPKSS